MRWLLWLTHGKLGAILLMPLAPKGCSDKNLESIPQGLKPFFTAVYGMAEAMPFQDSVLIRAFAGMVQPIDVDGFYL
jgi:hypothetical protein